ncbi:MAG: T9SS type A sorting domain-containing protein, partial [Bacteroidales bacterium]|nr:T9SS type A sorting domain-containing protein [Bacteroidales bacterium]
FIKINNGQAGWAINLSDLSETGTYSQMTGLRNCAMSGTTPASVLALVRQLVDECGIPQESIYIGEPMTHVYKSMYVVIHAEYPNVKILDKDGYTNLGRTESSGWTENVIFYSDKGEEMPDAISDNLMKEMYDADYLINAAALKAHARAGVSLNAKLHLGSHGFHPSGYGFGSFHMHAGLICTVDNDIMTSGVRGDYGMYRVLVDLMGHEKLGRNTVLFLIDGLWGGVEATDMPVKWDMAPFNSDFPSSLFISQDGVAAESVCLDFLRAEADHNEYFNERPFFPAVDDHLHQAADKVNWPQDFIYDPEDDGTEIPSMGVHEHWNNPTDKQYSRNLGTGEGIELVDLYAVSSTDPGSPGERTGSCVAFPNPCTNRAMISYSLKTESRVSISLVSSDGRLYPVLENEAYHPGNHTRTIHTGELSKGIYLCRIQINSGTGENVQTLKLVVK